MITTMDNSQKGLSIRGKMLIGFAAIVILSVISICFTWVITSRTENFSKNVISSDIPVYNALIDLNTELYETTISIQSYLITSDIAKKNDVNQLWQLLDHESIHIDDLMKNVNNNEIISQWNETKTSITDLKNTQLNIINAIDNKNIPLATQLWRTQGEAITKKVTNSLNQINQLNSNLTSTSLLDRQSEILKNGENQIINDLYYLKSAEMILLILSIAASIIIALYTAKIIVNPLKNAIQIAKNIASGTRDIPIQITTQDETGELLSALNSMQASIKENEIKLKLSEAHTRELFENVVKSAKKFSEHSSKVSSGDLRERLTLSEQRDKSSHDVMNHLASDLNKMTDNLSSIAKEITQSCHGMVTTLEEVRHAVDSQSSGASEQASSINEITASVSEIEKSTAQTMDKAKLLGEVAERTRERGQSGLLAVEQSVQGMKSVRDKVQIIAQTILDLSNQTQQVGEITAVVNNLAQQSKMLALNASIEAAKAGESGKGFAVVASEVKNLAEQSEESTEQVQKILEDIKRATEKAVMATEEGTKGVDYGTNLVEQTGEVIRSLNDVILETTVASQQIEAAVRQESAGIEQITAGMNEINQVTNTFVDSVKQTTEAMANLSDVAKKLQGRVDTYKT